MQYFVRQRVEESLLMHIRRYIYPEIPLCCFTLLQEEQYKEHRREKRRERKRKARAAEEEAEEEGGEVDPEMAAMMGFAGFGTKRKS